MSTFEVLCFTCGLVVFFYIFGKKPRRKNYPPAPWGLPVFGHMHAAINTHKRLFKWAQKFGPLFSIELGTYSIVVLNDAKTIRAAFNEQNCSGRPSISTMEARSNGIAEGLIMTEGNKWMEQRRFVIRTLRDFGFGKKSMEGAVHEEIKELIENFGKVVGRPVSTQKRFNAAVMNALWNLIIGERFKQDDPELLLAIDHLNTAAKVHNVRTGLGCFFPAFAKYFPKLSGFEYIASSFFPILEFLNKLIAQHKATFVAGQPRDFIDVYLEEIHNTTDPSSSIYKQNGEKSLPIVLFDLFIGGAETSSTTLTWTFLYLAKFPDKQTKLQAEIANVVGNSRLPSLADRPNMPYAEAVIHEVMRYSSLLHLGIIHRTVNEVNIGGFTIPKDTVLAPNFYTVHHDPKVWGDPENFRPERFLNNDGAFVKHESFMAFSAGKRVCLGETLGRDQLFLFTTSLFQAFTVSPVTSAKELSTEAFVGAVLMPQPHELILTSRI